MKFPSYNITVRDIYGTDDPKCPEGYEFTGEFRAPRNNEDILEPIQNNGTKVYNGVFNQSNWGATKPRLILRPVPIYSDSDILNFMICQIQNYNLGGCISDVYQDVGWKSADNFNRNAISAAMRRQNWPHKSS